MNIATACGVVNDVSYILNEEYYENLNSSLLFYLKNTNPATIHTGKLSFFTTLTHNVTGTTHSNLPKFSNKNTQPNSGNF
jgi:hypothetical protein